MGSLTADVNKPISYININVDQLNKTRAQQTQDRLTQRFSTPSMGYVAPPIDKIQQLQEQTQQLQEQTQQQNNNEINGLLQSTSNTTQPIRISSDAYQKLIQLRSVIDQEAK